MTANSTSAKISQWTGTKRKIKRILFFVLGFVVIITGILIYGKYIYPFSDGYRAGLLQKFSHKGNIIKTYEGEMILSSVTGNQNVAIASEKFLFSVTRKNLANQLDTSNRSLSAEKWRIFLA